MKKTKQKRGISPTAAAIAGAVVGVGVAAAGAIALSNKSNQKKMKGVYDKAKSKITGFVDNFNNKKEMVEEKVAEGKNKASKTINTVSGTNKKIKNIWQK
jgi:hypothetical protein